MSRRAPIAFALWVVASASAAHAAEQVTLQLKWHHQFQFAGYYVAQAQGYYRAAGLDVRIVEATPETRVVDEVVSGRAEFGVGTTELLLDRAAGKPVVVLAAIFQHSPIALAVRAERGLEHIHHLPGRRIMLEPGSAELRMLLERERVSISSLVLVPHTFSVRDLVEGRVDGASVYSTDEPYALNEAGVPHRLFGARMGGVDFYGDNLFTSEAVVAKRGPMVAAFRAASLRGWREALRAPSEAIELILRSYPTRKTRAHLEFEAARMRDLIAPDTVDVGYMYPGRWRHIAEVYGGLGLLSARVDLERFVYDSHPRGSELPPWVLWALFGAAAFAAIVAFFVVQLLRAKGRIDRSERRLRDLIDGAPIPILLSDTAEHRIRYLNGRARAALGASSGLLSESFYVEPADREALIAKLRAEGGVTDHELRLRRADGTAMLVLASSRLTEFDGAPAVITGFIDLTERERLESDLRAALASIRTLEGFLNICMHCKKIKSDEGWEPVEAYVAKRSSAEFSHGLCPDCLALHYAELLEHP